MRLIIIEKSAYEVSEKEYAKLKRLAGKLEKPSATANYIKYYEYEEKLANYLDLNKANYKYIDEVWFHHQR